MIILCGFVTTSDASHVTHHTHLTHFDIKTLISAVLICNLSVATVYVSHLCSHSVVIGVVNSVAYNDPIGFGRRMPQQGDRGGGHICKSHILWGVKWF